MQNYRSDLYDGFTTLQAGMNSSIAPDKIRPDQCVFAVNTTFRDGFAGSRPGFKQITLNFEDSEKRQYFEDHATQGACFYDPPVGREVLASSQGGRLFALQVKGDTADVAEFTPADGPNLSVTNEAWFCQAAQYLLVQDGVSRCVIYDGATVRRSKVLDDPDVPEIPVGRRMAYGNWRVFVELPDGRQLQAGDFAYVTPTSVIEFTETKNLNAGGTLSLPNESGGLRALIFMAQTDTVSGQGALLAATTNSIVSFNPVPLRTQWEQGGFSRIAVINRGFVSQGGTTLVNGDVWGRSTDGLRSFAMSQRQARTWAHTPMSQEINRIVEKDTESLLEYSSAIYFSDRLLVTCSPVKVNNGSGVYHRGIIALNFENLGTIYDISPPAYDGLWVGIQPYKLVTGMFDGVLRAFAFCRGLDGKTQLWEITKTDSFDNGNVPIQSFLETGSYVFKSPAMQKHLVGAEMWIDRLEETVNFDIKYRPDQYPCWVDWTTFTECAPIKQCDDALEGCAMFQEAAPQYRPRILLQAPPKSVCDPVLHTPFITGYQFQARIAWTGKARIKMFRLQALSSTAVNHPEGT